MSRTLWFVPLLLATGVGLADEVTEDKRVPGATEAQAQDDVPEAEHVPAAAETPEQTKEGPKVISGMSILGNQEAPKSLVIVPWRSSALGDSLALSAILDDSRQPIDKEVFMRALSYYEIRSGTTP